MAKISSYAKKVPPVFTDMLIGTDTTSVPVNQTKNFTVQQLSDLINNDLIFKKVVIPTANAKTLVSTPYELLPPSGVGKAYFIDNIAVSKPAGTAYNFGSPNSSAVTLYFVDSNGATLANWLVVPNLYGLTGAAATGVMLFKTEEVFEIFPLLDNCSLYIQSNASADATNDGADLVFNITYRELPE